MKASVKIGSKINLENWTGASAVTTCRERRRKQQVKITRRNEDGENRRGCTGCGPRLFIGGKNSTVENFKLNGKKHPFEGSLGISSKTPGAPPPGKTFSFASILDPKVSLAQVCIQGKRFAIEGLLLGRFGIGPSHTQRVENSHAKDVGGETSEAVDCIFHLLGIAFWQSTLRSRQSHQHKSNSTQGGIVAPVNSFRDETPGAKVVHIKGLNLGFEQGVSSFLTLNESKLECVFVSGDKEC
jgi:hypothetical protein